MFGISFPEVGVIAGAGFEQRTTQKFARIRQTNCRRFSKTLYCFSRTFASTVASCICFVPWIIDHDKEGVAIQLSG